jgi:glycosyltransferase involved in cell wall biosynthesis
MNPQVSIIVPVYNVSKFIERCARSLFEQTFKSIEYIFINDFTPDNSIEILKDVIKDYPQIESQIKLVDHPQNRGLAAARNSGLKCSTGDFIIHIDSDDFIEKNAIELLYQKAIADEADIVICDLYLDWGRAKKVWMQEFYEDSLAFTKKTLSVDLMPWLSSKLINRNLYFKNDIWGFEGIDMGEDYVLTTRLCYFASKISKVGKPLYHYNQINENAFSKTWSDANTKNIIDGLKIVSDFFESQPDYASFRESIEEGKIRKKIDLYRYSRIENKNIITEGIVISPYTYKKIKLSLHQKSLFILGSHFNKYFLIGYIYMYKLLVEIYQRIKGRK